jgi:beta-RFAP synthase
MTHSVRVRAPCRLHFGMFGFGHGDSPQFGGVGMMVEPPAVEVTVTPAETFKVTGLLADRAQCFAKMAASRWRLPSLPACEIRVQSPRDHVGLGVGTQLGLSVAVGLRRFLNLQDLPIETLAADVGRGMRSAVGTYGFRSGGLIVDAGHSPGQSIGNLSRREAIPADWRVLLVAPQGQRGLAGTSEAGAFTRLPPVPRTVTRQLWQIVERELLPALHCGDCATFGDAVYRFGRLSGECFSTVQGGPFASQAIAEQIEAIRDAGIPGVGQSSWGPTVFAICSSQADAQALVTSLGSMPWGRGCLLDIALPSNTGAQLEVRHD